MKEPKLPDGDFSVDGKILEATGLAVFHSIGRLLTASNAQEAMRAAYECALFFEATTGVLSGDFLEHLVRTDPDLGLEDGDHEGVVDHLSKCFTNIHTKGDWALCKEIASVSGWVAYEGVVVDEGDRRFFYQLMGISAELVPDENSLITPEEHLAWFTGRLSDRLGLIPDTTDPWRYPDMGELVQKLSMN